MPSPVKKEDIKHFRDHFALSIKNLSFYPGIKKYILSGWTWIFLPILKEIWRDVWSTCWGVLFHHWQCLHEKWGRILLFQVLTTGSRISALRDEQGWEGQAQFLHSKLLASLRWYLWVLFCTSHGQPNWWTWSFIYLSSLNFTCSLRSLYVSLCNVYYLV